MPRILLFYYSQSGESARTADALAGSLKAPDMGVVIERLRPRHDYPFPWRSVQRFFDVLPECHLGPLPELEPPGFDPEGRFDLIILVYQVWFLTPSLPVQSFLASPAARVLRDTPVVTVSVSRNMWHSASEMMKGLLARSGAQHVANIAVTHQGPAWATFITTPRSLLFGKTGGFWSIFPPAGIGDAELERVRHCGEVMARQVGSLQDTVHPLAGVETAHVNRRYLIADFLGWYWFRGWAFFLKFLGRFGAFPRRMGIYLFVICLLFAIAIAIPLSMVLRILLWPLLQRWTDDYVRRLKQPSGS